MSADLLQIGLRHEVHYLVNVLTQEASPKMNSMKRICAAISSFANHQTCPLRIMCIASYPRIVRRAASKERKPRLAFTRLLIER
jgi:hypothetical protein